VYIPTLDAWGSIAKILKCRFSILVAA